MVRLVERHRHEAMNHERWRELERWLSLIPRPLIETRPELLVLEAWIVEKQWRYADLPAYLDRIEVLMEHITSPEADRTRLVRRARRLCAAWSSFTPWTRRALLHLCQACPGKSASRMLLRPRDRLVVLRRRDDR